MLIRRLVTKNLHRLMVFGILACLILDISFIDAYMPDMQLPAPTHEMLGNARIVRSEAVWHEEFDAISNLRFRLGPPPHPALGLAQYSHKGHPAYAIDRWCLFTLGCFFSVTLMRNPCSQTWKPYRPFLGARGI